MFPTCIATERLILRQWRESDREPFARINADPLVMEFMPHALSKEESDSVADRIEAHFRQRGSRRVMEKLGMTHNPVDDFDHPRLPDGHPLRRHVLYRMNRSVWRSGL